MVGSLAKYVARSPRYILQPDDNTLIRLAGPQQTPWEEGTEIRNISLTGLAFTAPLDLAPIVGEVIKIQFAPPQKNEMACYGLVTRMENLRSGSVLVAIKFLKLDFPQRLYLAHALSLRLREQQERERHVELNFRWREKLPQMILAWFLLGLWMITLWAWMSGFLSFAANQAAR
ncbi:MAG: PilZ domain-containing protein [Bdellovibrionaceae bacterium]|nr:PilZ domain-containing protein [Pseudobdellovibrionaceae bacterium]